MHHFYTCTHTHKLQRTHSCRRTCSAQHYPTNAKSKSTEAVRLREKGFKFSNCKTDRKVVILSFFILSLFYPKKIIAIEPHTIRNADTAVCLCIIFIGYSMKLQYLPTKCVLSAFLSISISLFKLTLI